MSDETLGTCNTWGDPHKLDAYATWTDGWNKTSVIHQDCDGTWTPLAPVSALKDAEEVVTELRSLKSALIIASVDLTDAEERREQENRFAALVDYTNDMQAQLARANAVIERVGAAVQWALRQIENPPETHWPQGEGYEGMNYGLGHARGALIEAFNDDDLRTILEGASNE